MPTVFSHPAVPLALGLGLGPRAVPARLLAAGIVASILPDLDVVGLYLGVPYSAGVGHRGFTHSFLFAAAVGLAGVLARHALGAGAGFCFLFLFVVTASHGVLDGFTDGGLGVAYFWPWSARRFGAPWVLRVVKVSPITVHFFSQGGLRVLASELIWIWPPAVALGLILFAVCRRARAPERTGP